jgi:hypothetical protein
MLYILLSSILVKINLWYNKEEKGVKKQENLNWENIMIENDIEKNYKIKNI